VDGKKVEEFLERAVDERGGLFPVTKKVAFD